MPNATQGFAPPVQTPNPFPGNVPQQGGPYVSAGAPSAGTSCVQTLTTGGTPTAGSFTLIFGNQATGAIVWSATDATFEANIATALNALSDIGTSGVAVTAGTGSSGIGTYLITFQNQNADLTVPAIVVGSNSLTGTAPTVAVAVTTAGVTATLRGGYPGTVVYDYVNNKEWVNVGTAAAPQFARTGANYAVVPLTATTSTGGGTVAAWAPPEGGPVFITRALMVTTVVATGAATVTVGTAANATTSSGNLMTTADVHTATIAYDNIVNASTSGKAMQYLAAGSYITATGSADTTGLVGTLLIEYIKP